MSNLSNMYNVNFQNESSSLYELLFYFKNYSRSFRAVHSVDFLLAFRTQVE